jgi:hypothetical protein
MNAYKNVLLFLIIVALITFLWYILTPTQEASGEQKFKIEESLLNASRQGDIEKIKEAPETGKNASNISMFWTTTHLCVNDSDGWTCIKDYYDNNDYVKSSILISDTNKKLIGEEDVIIMNTTGELQIIEIKTAKRGGKRKFPFDSYPYYSSNPEIRSGLFVVLDNKHTDFLDGNLLLAPLIENESVASLAVIYTKETACHPENVGILGRYYRVVDLENGSAFENDSRFIVKLDTRANDSRFIVNTRDNDICLGSVSIFSNNSFSGLKSGQQIYLFGKRIISAKFVDLESEPKLIITVAKTNETNPKPLCDESRNCFFLDENTDIELWYGDCAKIENISICYHGVVDYNEYYSDDGTTVSRNANVSLAIFNSSDQMVLEEVLFANFSNGSWIAPLNYSIYEYSDGKVIINYSFIGWTFYSDFVNVILVPNRPN